MAVYTIKKGDTLWDVAKRNPSPGKTITQRVREIAEASGIKNANRLKIGQNITIPGGKETTVDIPTPRMRPEPKPAAPLEGVPPGVGANRAAIEASRQDGSMGGAFTSAAPSIMADNYPAGAGGARPDPTRRPWLAPRPPPPMPLEGTAQTSQGQSATASGIIPALLEGGATTSQGMGATASGEMQSVPMDPGMDVTGLIQEVSPEERGLQGGAMPLPIGPEAMDPMIAQQLQAVPQEPAVIGPQFTTEGFAPTPMAGADPELQAIMNDPARRQMMMQMLMQGGM